MGSFRLDRQQRAVAAASPILLVSLFLTFSAVFEVTPVVRLVRPQLILAAIGLFVLFMTGRFLQVLAMPIAKTLLLFTGWFLVCVPFAIWRGGPVYLFIDVWYKAVLMFVLTAGLLSTLPQTKRLFGVIGYAVALMAFIALVKGSYQGGRLELANTRFANANEMAATLLVGVIFLGYSWLRGTRRDRIIAVGLSAIVVLALLKTGPRAALLGAGMLCLFVFLQASKKTKVGIATAVPFILLALLIAVPSSLKQRYLTLFQPAQGLTERAGMSKEQHESYMATVSAAGSAENRLKLLKDSITITFQNPVFGVGPGNFMVAQDKLARSRGEPYGLWHVTHNTYVQVSSEMGIPGLILYIAFLYQTFKTLTSIVRNKHKGAAWRELRELALTLRAVIVIMATVAFFDSFAYLPDVPILAGMAAALGAIAHQQRIADKMASARQEAVSAPLRQPELEPAWTTQI